MKTVTKKRELVSSNKTTTKAKSTRPKKRGESELDVDIRLNKFIADAGITSRRKADELILDGAVKVNGIVVDQPGTKVNKTDFVTVHGDPVKEKTMPIYIVLNKPKNVITTTDDELGRKTVLDIVKKHARIYPVGRLDRNTTGVLLLTNDGELAHRLTHPSFEIERVYDVKLDHVLKTEDAKAISQGVELENGEMTQPCELFIHTYDKSKVTITLREGKNHEVRRIFETFEYEVKQLDRKSFAGINVSGLPRGTYRHLNRKELQHVKKIVKLN
jgi:23S rRNA pseudouridine2605 synthase